MPSFVPAHREVIYGSGVAELLCAAGMLHPRTRRVAGYASPRRCSSPCSPAT